MTEDDGNTFVRLFGDVNGDGVVNAADKAFLMQAEANLASPYAPDFEDDGNNVIDKVGFAQFDKRYKGRMNPPMKAPAKFTGLKVPHHVASHNTSTTRSAGANGAKSTVRQLKRSINLLPPGGSHQS